MCILYPENIASILKAVRYWPVLFWGIHENEEDIRGDIEKENQRKMEISW
jgi:hypothetical protein